MDHESAREDCAVSSADTNGASPPPEERLTLFRETAIPRKRLMRPSQTICDVVSTILEEMVEKIAEPEDRPCIQVKKRICVPDEDLCISEGWCSVCNGGESNSDDLIVYCDMCGIPVHQSCYGIPHIPKGDWNCQRCVALLETNQSPTSMICVICHRYGGAMKPLRRIQRVTTEPEWVHVLCVWWDHDVVVPNMQVMEPLQMVHPPMNNRQQKCMICNRNEGYLIQCHWSQCNSWFHAICARFGDSNIIHRHRSTQEDHQGGGFLQVDIEHGSRAAFHGYCKRHALQEFCLDDIMAKILATNLLNDMKIQSRLEKLPGISPDPDVQLAALGKYLVRYAEQTMASMASLQLLQMFVDHFPQIYKTYPSTTIQIHDILGASWIEKLQSTFGRQADDPFHYCMVCHVSLSHVDHGFYCTNTDRPHVQHWRCIAKASQLQIPIAPTTAPVGRPKKKLKAGRGNRGVAHQPAVIRYTPVKEWTESNHSDMQCALCASPMDLRAVAVPKTSKFDIEPYIETSSVYSHQGRFVNVVSPPEPKAPPATTLPSSDRFRVSRGTKLVADVASIISKAMKSHKTEDDAVYAEMLGDMESLLEWVKPIDAYAFEKLTQIQTMLIEKKGPAVAMLKQIIRDYTKLLHAKHVRAVEKGVLDQRKKEFESVIESKRIEREQFDTEAEKSLKEQMQALKRREKARERNLKRQQQRANASGTLGSKSTGKQR